MVPYKDLASDAWMILKQHFACTSCGSSTKILPIAIKSRFRRLIFFTELGNIWEELENHRLMPECRCPVQCTCEAMRNARALHKEDYIMRFLKGLNENYAMVKSRFY